MCTRAYRLSVDLAVSVSSCCFSFNLSQFAFFFDVFVSEPAIPLLQDYSIHYFSHAANFKGRASVTTVSSQREYIEC